MDFKEIVLEYIEILQLNEIIAVASKAEKEKAKKQGKGEIHYVVKTKDGKRVLGYCKSYEDAKKRLRQVEYFKHNK